MKTTQLKEIVSDQHLVAFCGLYCGACRSYLSGKCPGCRENTRATWCKVRSCCMENQLTSCADCTSMELKACKKHNNFLSRLIGVVLNSDRAACIERIRVIGHESFANEMTLMRRQTIARK